MYLEWTLYSCVGTVLIYACVAYIGIKLLRTTRVYYFKVHINVWIL